MGNIPSGSTDAYDENQSQLKIVLNLQQPVKEELKQLLSWSLSEIRNIYAPFRRRKGSPILTRSEFLRFIQLSRITSFYIYDHITKQQPINVFEIMSILILTAHTTYSYKLQFIFNVFDLSCNKNLQFYELILMFKSMVRGFSFLTGQQAPENTLLEKYARAMFSRADLNNDQILEIGEILGWLETNTECLNFFKMFQPSLFGKQDYHIFNPFVAYTSEEIQIITTRLSKVYNKQKLQEEDYLMLKPLASRRLSSKENKFDFYATNLSSGISNTHTLQTFQGSFASKKNPANTGTSISKFDKHKKSHQCYFPSVRKSVGKLSPVQSSGKSLWKKGKKFENIIIIKGRSITKKEVYELREYFDLLSVGKKEITIEDFLQSFNQEKYNHMKSVAASLFNFLDKKQSGKVQFIDLVMKLYPNLSAKHLETINFWSEEYNRNFNLDKKIKANRNNEDSKKRVLPKSCIQRLRQLFEFFDSEKKGWVDIENLRQVLGNASTQRQIKQIFEKCDVDCDNKLSLKQFAHVLLPPDLEIEGLM